MKITPLDIPDVLLIEPIVFEDDRGFFFESFNLNKFNEITPLDVPFVQDNHTRSLKGVLRGLHYQIPPHAQGKIVRVIRGEVFDVAVDIRKSSPTFGKHVTQILSAENKKQVWIPEGFAHGFLTLSEHSELLYKITVPYCKDYEKSIHWNDSLIDIQWPKTDNLIISDKDRFAKNLDDICFEK